MKLQNIYDSVPEAVMRKVENSIINNDSHFDSGFLWIGHAAIIKRCQKPFIDAGLVPIESSIRGRPISDIISKEDFYENSNKG